jgi:hypothetical protein
VVEDFEAGAGAENPAHLEAIRTALEAAGVEFTEVEGRPGVRLQKSKGNKMPAYLVWKDGHPTRRTISAR